MAKKKSEPAKTDEVIVTAAEDMPLDVKSLKPGNILTFCQWAKVVRVVSASKLELESLDGGDDFLVEGLSLITKAMSADLFLREERLSLTEIIKKLKASFNVPFSVCFVKQDGTERVLRGRLVSSEADDHGRLLVVDLDISHSENRYRLVDCRTIQWLVVGNIRYKVK